MINWVRPANINFGVICFLVVAAPLARGSVHLWATTLIQMCALTGVFLIIVGHFFSNSDVKLKTQTPKHRRHKKSTPQYPDKYILSAMALVATLSALFSNHPSLSAEGLSMLFTYMAIYWMTKTSVNTRKKHRILVYVIIANAVFMSILGLLILNNINPFPLWDYVNPNASSLTGPYVNRNHMAGFLEMTIPMMLALFITRERPLEIRAPMIAIALLLITSLILTLSRGGWAGTCGALIFMAVVLFFQKAMYRTTIVILTVLVLATGVWVLSTTTVVQRIATLTQKDTADNLAERTRTWTGTMAMIKDHPLTGTGTGTFTEAYPAYQIPGTPHLSVYAHNDYLHFVADTGVLIIPVILWILFVFFQKGFSRQKSQSRQTQGFALGVMAAMLAIAIHSFSDFNLHIPANILLFTVLAGLLRTTQSQLPN